MARSFVPRLLLVLCALGGLAACSNEPPPRPVFPEIHFTDQAPFRLAVGSIEIKNTFQPSFKSPEVEHLFPVPPARAMETWAHDRLQASGGPGSARVTITDATVTETELPKEGGLTGAVTKQQAERYDATLQMTIEIVNDRGYADRVATGKATRSQSVKEGITPNERDQIWYDMTKAVMADLDKTLTSEIQNNFGTYLQ